MEETSDDMTSDDRILFVNYFNKSRYKYARPFVGDGDSKIYHGSLTRDGLNLTRVHVLSLPDGVHANMREALVPRDATYRLYIFSDRALGDDQLQSLDNIYGRRPYPLLETVRPVANLVTFPKVNFYMTLDEERPSVVSSFIEYRYLQQRHEPATIAYVPGTGEAFRLLLPKKQARLVLVMPENFIKTGNRTGYFMFRGNLIVRIYSRFLLSASRNEPENDLDGELVSDVSVGASSRIESIVRAFFARFGLHRVTSLANDQILASDRYVTAIVGSLSNVSL